MMGKQNWYFQNQCMLLTMVEVFILPITHLVSVYIGLTLCMYSDVWTIKLVPILMTNNSFPWQLLLIFMHHTFNSFKLVNGGYSITHVKIFAFLPCLADKWWCELSPLFGYSHPWHIELLLVLSCSSIRQNLF